jgi:hypothetical protein
MAAHIAADQRAVASAAEGNLSGCLSAIRIRLGVPAVAPGQARGAYSIEWNGQSRSSHSRTVR